jgi:hypothetical protein
MELSLLEGLTSLTLLEFWGSGGAEGAEWGRLSERRGGVLGPRAVKYIYNSEFLISLSPHHFLVSNSMYCYQVTLRI